MTRLSGSLMLDVAGTYLTSEDRQILRQPEVGGLIIFARNIEHPKQVRELCQSIRALRPDLLLAVDQEGGRVQRLRRDFVKLPAMGDLADKPNAGALARECGWLMATEVLSVGLDFSFAPVLDVNYGQSAVIGKRAFGQSPLEVQVLAGAFIEGMQQAGMAATGKHFPGHGFAEADSHVAIPVDDRSLDEIRQKDLQPFKALAEKLAAVMPAHVIYPQVDPNPAGFSRYWLQEILRKELGFNGVIFSDDLSMAGAHVVGDAAARIEAAISAGCDMGLVCNDRASAELALARLQTLKVIVPKRLNSMRAKRSLGVEYKQSPRWLAALNALKQVGLAE